MILVEHNNHLPFAEVPPLPTSSPQSEHDLVRYLDGLVASNYH